jgi:hypothetical protein
MTSAGGTGALGTWALVVRTPVGSLRVQLVVTDRDGELTGVARGQGEDVLIAEMVVVDHADGPHLTWTQRVTRPLRLTLDFDVLVTGDVMAGTARAGRLPASAVSGTRGVRVS